MPGVIRTRVGYSGGEKINPAYHDLGDHTETLQVDYDPQRISYQALLEAFWDGHNPTIQSGLTQYKNILFYHDDEQKNLAEQSRREKELVRGEPILTEFRPASRFYRAEDYHQKHVLRAHPDLLAELTAYYPNPDDLTDSTAAARINGFLAGQGCRDTLEEEILSYGLSMLGREKLLGISDRLPQSCPI
jgi:methionine-S-sulfoxide reductase